MVPPICYLSFCCRVWSTCARGRLLPALPASLSLSSSFRSSFLLLFSLNFLLLEGGEGSPVSFASVVRARFPFCRHYDAQAELLRYGFSFLLLPLSLSSPLVN